MTKRALALIAVLALPLTLPGCKQGENPNEPDDRLPTPEELALRLEPESIDFTHTVGRSPCPQLIGRVTIRNAGTTAFTTALHPEQAGVPLSFGPNQTVQPGQSVTIDVFFTCASQSSFIAFVDTLPAGQGGGSSNALDTKFVVRATIVR
jgi:hypothetical protein